MISQSPLSYENLSCLVGEEILDEVMIESLGIAYRNINSGVCIVYLKRKGWHWHTDMICMLPAGVLKLNHASSFPQVHFPPHLMDMFDFPPTQNLKRTATIQNVLVAWRG
ncbi:hypothetical protein ACE6H2_028765 [Prunus campanulata]